jgi:hypothetical protein
MIHEKIVSKDKQLIESIESESSNRSMRKIRRESIISTDEIEDEFDAAATHITFKILIR